MNFSSVKYEVPYDHWQLTTSNKLFLCPYEDACIGETYTLNYTINGTISHARDYFLLNQCYSDFSGLLCSQPSQPNHYIDHITRDTESCMLSDRINVGYLTLCGAALVFSLYFVGIVRYVKKDDREKEDRDKDKDKDKDKDNIDQGVLRLSSKNKVELLIALKLLLFNLQITSQLPVMLYSSFPQITSMILKIYGFLSLSSTFLVPFSCLSDHVTVTYHHLMYVSTLFPLFLFFCLSLITCTLNEIAYLGNPFEIDEGDEESQLDDDHEAFVMAIVEQREQQQFNYFYKLIAVIFFFYDLWIGNISQLLFGSLFCVQLNENDALPQSSFLVLWNDPTVQCHQSDFYDVFTLLWIIAFIVFFLFLFPLIEIGIISSVSTSLQVNAMRLERATSSTTSESTTLSTASLDSKKIPSTASIFLFEYLFEGVTLKGLAKYWSILEAFYRVLMIGLLPLLFTQDNRIYKTATTIILSVVFLVMLVKCRPYHKRFFQSFMEISSFLLTCYLFVTLFAQINVTDVVESKGFDLIFSLLLLTSPCYFCYHMISNRSSEEKVTDSNEDKPTEEKKRKRQRSSSSPRLTSSSSLGRSWKRRQSSLTDSDVDELMFYRTLYRLNSNAMRNERRRASPRHQRIFSSSPSRRHSTSRSLMRSKRWEERSEHDDGSEEKECLEYEGGIEGEEEDEEEVECEESETALSDVDHEEEELNSEDQRDIENTVTKLDNTLDFTDIYECFEEEDDIEQPQSHYPQLSYRQTTETSATLLPLKRSEEDLSLGEEEKMKQLTTDATNDLFED